MEFFIVVHSWLFFFKEAKMELDSKIDLLERCMFTHIWQSTWQAQPAITHVTWMNCTSIMANKNKLQDNVSWALLSVKNGQADRISPMATLWQLLQSILQKLWAPGHTGVAAFWNVIQLHVCMLPFLCVTVSGDVILPNDWSLNADTPQEALTSTQEWGGHREEREGIFPCPQCTS